MMVKRKGIELFNQHRIFFLQVALPIFVAWTYIALMTSISMYRFYLIVTSGAHLVAGGGDS